MIRPLSPTLALAAALLLPAISVAQRNRSEDPGPAPPIERWLAEGEVEQIRWDLDIDDPLLRMDQRIEVFYTGRVRIQDLQPIDADRELQVWNWIHDDDDTLVAESGPIRYAVGQGFPDGAEVEFYFNFYIAPGRYTIRVLLHDEVSGRHNLRRESLNVNAPGNDPFPDAWSETPRVVFRRQASSLALPVKTARPVEIELIAALNSPESATNERARSRYTALATEALTALAELDPARGSIVMTGLDMIQREIRFEHADPNRIRGRRIAGAFADSNPSSIGIGALAGRDQNPVFLKKFVEGRVEGRILDGRQDQRIDVPLKALIVLTGFTQFADSADKTPVAFEGSCDCRVYLIRMRMSIRDVFDDVEKLLDPLASRTFNVLTPSDLRKAMGEIVRDLQRF
jgi:hypothetical protein